ncbi:MAG: anthranilate synthase component I family protein [Candidatus Dadabacteria bacterium]|nr:MAG: anthranilate synthase component I family protein [Candidatus Dadabacteria bacterium]
MSKKYEINYTVNEHLADTLTPVSIYLKLRDLYPRTLLLESADFRASQGSFSYICAGPCAEFTVKDNSLAIKLPDSPPLYDKLSNPLKVPLMLKDFLARFKLQSKQSTTIPAGLFGYTAFDALRYFDDFQLQIKDCYTAPIPEIHYALYRYIIAVDHYRNRLYLATLEIDGNPDQPLLLPSFESLKFSPLSAPSEFTTDGELKSNMTDEQFIECVKTCKKHIQRGDVFQIVPSRRFYQSYRGDDFNVYRQLRSINPSPYLFYFDCGDYKIFGSSPEAQLKVSDGVARLYPIAGTYKRSGNEEQDLQSARRLRDDPKENSEHVMLVDLARNDLSRHCSNVTVEAYKEIQLFSHVIHLTSRVSGTLHEKTGAVDLLVDTFPMGTLSGAPKRKAIELLSCYEPDRRMTYGGAIGFLGFDGSCNHAIIIRSFLCRDRILHFQAGAGIVADSNPQSELAEINNKSGALRQAIINAMGAN